MAAIAALLISVSLVAFAVTSMQYRIDRQHAFERQQAEVIALRAELSCRAGESSRATELEGQLIREMANGIARYVSTGNGDDPIVRRSAERVEDLYAQLGPQLEERRQAVATCD